METKDHQTPSLQPREKRGGKCLGFACISYIENNVDGINGRNFIFNIGSFKLKLTLIRTLYLKGIGSTSGKIGLLNNKIRIWEGQIYLNYIPLYGLL